MPGGRLVVSATPIGNLGDISGRLRDALVAADLVYAEDTRRTAKLLRYLAIDATVVSLFAGNERARTEELVAAVEGGKTVVLVSDAGMPTVSDPGAAAVRAVRSAGHPVTVIPGPSAVTTALALSGFGGDRFTFEGFLPRRGAERSRRLSDIAADPRVTILFASPNRLSDDLADLAEACGSAREVAVTRELTKLHEEVWVGPLGEAVERWSQPVKGEVTLVLGPVEATSPAVETGVEMARSLVNEGMRLSEAARKASERTGTSRHAVYEALLADQESS